MKTLATAALFLLTPTALAAEADKGPEQVHHIADAGKVRLDLGAPSYTAWGSSFSSDGSRINGLPVQSSMVFTLAGRVGLIDGLELGTALPLVQNVSGAAGDPDRTRVGLGDIAFHAGGEARLDSIDIGGTVEVKVPSGSNEAGGGNPARPVGSGQPDLDLRMHLTRWSGDVLVEGEFGYLVRFEGVKDTGTAEFDYKPGDVVHLELGIVAWSSGRYGAGLHGLYHSARPESWETAGGLTPMGDGSAMLSAVVSFTIRAADYLDVSLSTRADNIGTDFSVVDTGIPILGRNTQASTVPLSAAAHFRF